MGLDRGKRFRFTLGKIGFVFFVFGISALLLLSFLFGVMVGRNIDTYPQKIAKEIPAAVTKKIAGVIQGETAKEIRTEGKPAGENGKTDGKPAGEQGKAEEKTAGEHGKTESSFQYRYFETLTQKKEPAPAAALPPPEEQYVIQVGSFRHRGQAEEVQKTLLSSGFHPVLDQVEMKESGNWYRVRLLGYRTLKEAKEAQAVVEKKLQGTRCIVRKETS